MIVSTDTFDKSKEFVVPVEKWGKCEPSDAFPQYSGTFTLVLQTGTIEVWGFPPPVRNPTATRLITIESRYAETTQLPPTP